jgi:hypothetical protein
MNLTSSNDRHLRNRPRKEYVICRIKYQRLDIAERYKALYNLNDP